MIQPPDRQPRYDRADDSAGARQYDSFVVRLWHDPATHHLLRAEVRHVQTDHAATVVDLAPEWLTDTILGFLQPDLVRSSASEAG